MPYCPPSNVPLNSIDGKSEDEKVTEANAGISKIIIDSTYKWDENKEQ